jgi:F1F0 ATPase subunit 2
MTDAAGWAIAALAGGLAGLLYFAGLWWTVQRARHARRPQALLAVSFIVRAALAVAALLFIMGDSVMRLVAALAGFLIVRTIVLWRVRQGLRSARV